MAAGDPDRDTRSAPSVLAVLLRPSFPAQQHDDQDEDEEEYDEDEQHAGGERPKMGVWTKARVRKRTRFGPYEGDITPIDRDGVSGVAQFLSRILDITTHVSEKTP